jgi:hypothetical protein
MYSKAALSTEDAWSSQTYQVVLDKMEFLLKEGWINQENKSMLLEIITQITSIHTVIEEMYQTKDKTSAVRYNNTTIEFDSNYKKDTLSMMEMFKTNLLSLKRSVVSLDNPMYKANDKALQSLRESLNTQINTINRLYNSEKFLSVRAFYDSSIERGNLTQNRIAELESLIVDKEQLLTTLKTRITDDLKKLKSPTFQNMPAMAQMLTQSIETTKERYERLLELYNRLVEEHTNLTEGKPAKFTVKACRLLL